MTTTTWSDGNCTITVDTTALDKMIKELDPNAKRIIRQVALQAQGEMMSMAAVDTGAMKNSVAVVMQDFSDQGARQGAAKGTNPDAEIVEIPSPGEEAEANIGPTVEYAVYVEFGTSKMGAQPFVIPAAQSAERNLERLASTQLVQE